MGSVANGAVGSVSFQAPAVQSVSKAPLTKREFEVLELMAEGITTKAIGARLGVTFKTAACHRGRILQKLGVESTVSAVRWAIRQGLITP
jgi:two-component system, NarL family, response regulator NreC